MNPATDITFTASRTPALSPTVRPASALDGHAHHRLRSAALIFLAWTTVGAFLAVPDMLHGLYWHVFAAKIIEAWAWALLTPLILVADRKISTTGQNIFRQAALFLLLSIPFSLAHTYLSGVLLYPIPQITWNPLRNSGFVNYYFLGSWQIYTGVIGILQATKYHSRLLTSKLQLERVEKSLIESHLNTLRLQLEPHFLFNTLNAISSEMGEGSELAREMIEDLAALLRHSLDCQDRAEITLAQELTLLEHYISIQKVRFGSRIQIRIDVDSAVLPAMVPSMLLQPLVENAIRHGIEGRVSGGTITISASKAGGSLHIQVLDDGVGLPRNWRADSSGGLGIRVTRERLEALYPQIADHCFAIRRRESGGTDVAICIPLDRTGR